LGAIGRSGSETRILLVPGATQRLRDLPAPARITLLAGPEGGLAPEEQHLATACGFQPVRLGPRILRTETAAMAAMAAMQALWGDF
jgi:16S rRNA (uracil1498-N3)-methyltransferase